MIDHVYVQVYDFASFYIFRMDFGTVPTAWYILELFRQRGIFWNCSDNAVYIGTVPTTWYILELFRQRSIVWNCSDNVTYILELFRQRGIFWNCSDNVV